MYCKKCGKKLPDDAVFCPTCGTKVDNEPVKEQPEKRTLTEQDKKMELQKDSLMAGKTEPSTSSMFLWIGGFIIMLIAIWFFYGWIDNRSKQAELSKSMRVAEEQSQQHNYTLTAKEMNNTFVGKTCIDSIDVHSGTGNMAILTIRVNKGWQQMTSLDKKDFALKLNQIFMSNVNSKGSKMKIHQAGLQIYYGNVEVANGVGSDITIKG